jgi:RNA polymerase sigma factor (TIGR02999 family)
VSEVTQLLEAIHAGQPTAAEQLLPLVYGELRKLAAARMAQEKPGQTLQATALVHEAWLRLVGAEEQRAWNNRGHFFGAAAEAMRRILVDRARQKARVRHGGGLERVDLEHVTLATEDSDDTVLAIHEAIEKLARESPQKAEIVKLRFHFAEGFGPGTAHWVVETGNPEAPNRKTTTWHPSITRMKPNCDPLNRHRTSRWLTAGSALALLLGTHLAQAAEVVFNDGLTHTISDASFQNDTLTVENGTKLIINSGAVFGGSATNSGQILIKDTSMLTIHQGIFGGTGNISGRVRLFDTSAATINGGTFGGTGERSGELNPRNGSQWKIRAEGFDTTTYNPTSGGTLGVTFPQQSPQFISVITTGGTVQLEVVVPAPELRMALTTAGLELSWSQSAVGYRLQSAVSLGTASEWTVWPEAPVSMGDRWVVQLPPATTASGHQFFRLHQQ